MKAPANVPQLISLKDAAEALGSDERTVRRFIGSQGRDRLIAAKIGSRWRIRLTDLEDFIDKHTRRAS